MRMTTEMSKEDLLDEIDGLLNLLRHGRGRWGDPTWWNPLSVPTLGCCTPLKMGATGWEPAPIVEMPWPVYGWA